MTLDEIMVARSEEIAKTRNAFATYRRAGLSAVAHGVALITIVRKDGAGPKEQAQIALGISGKVSDAAKTDSAAKLFNCIRNMLNNLAKREALQDIALLAKAKEPDYDLIVGAVLLFCDAHGITNHEALNHWLATGKVKKAKTDKPFAQKFAEYLEKAANAGEITGEDCARDMGEALATSFEPEIAHALLEALQDKLGEVEAMREAYALRAAALAGSSVPADSELYRAA